MWFKRDEFDRLLEFAPDVFSRSLFFECTFCLFDALFVSELHLLSS